MRASLRPSVHPSTFNMGILLPIVLKLCMCFSHGMRMCMWIGHNCWINFCHVFDIVNLVIFHPDYIDRGYLL